MLRIEPVHERHKDDFLKAATASVSLHHPWIAPPRSGLAFDAHLRRYRRDEQASFIGLTQQGRPVGCVHLNEIVYGALQSAYLAYFVFRPFDGRGLMRELLAGVIDHAFQGLRLHRLEANIQPENSRSKMLAQALGFRLEGFSPRYLYIEGAWRDHERYAITVEEWQRPGA